MSIYCLFSDERTISSISRGFASGYIGLYMLIQRDIGFCVTILSAISFPINYSVAIGVFMNYLLEAVSAASETVL